MKVKIGWNDGHTLTGIGTGAEKIIKETDRNRAIGSRAREILKSEYEGVEIVNCTIDKSNDDMAAAVKIANENKCDAFISNHVNAGGGVGFEGFYSRLASGNDIAKGKIIYDKLCATKSCLVNRRYCSDYSYKGYDFYVLKNTDMAAFLYEIGFVDNQQCVNAINNEEVARGYAEGIAAAYGLKKKSEVPSLPNPSPSKELYRVRKSWSDAASQLGAYSELQNAKNACKEGYSIYDSKGNCVYTNNSTPPTQPPTPSKSKVDVFSKVDGYNWVKNREDYAGDKKTSIEKVFIYPSKGEVLFRVSPLNRDYYPWVQNHKSANNIYDFAGDGKNPIDRIQCKLKSLEGYSIRYRAFTAQDGWLSWVTNDSDYAGIRGRAILAIEVDII